MSRPGSGKGIAWLRENAAYAGDDCLIWPLHRNKFTGYGAFGYLGKIYYAHRYMCELAHGPAPGPDFHAAHSCGRGHEGCCNPRHLSWQTISENQKDRRRHGTQTGAKGSRTRLSQTQIADMRALKGRLSEYKIAERFGVKRGTVQYWLNRDDPPKPAGSSRSSTYRRERGISRARNNSI